MATGRDNTQNKYSEQNILNSSYDKTYDILAVENCVYNPTTSAIDRMVQPSGDKKYNTNAIDDYTTTNVTYICKEGKDTADWWFIKIDETGNFLLITHATVTNNPTVTTYSAAYSARATTLVYSNYNLAF